MSWVQGPNRFRHEVSGTWRGRPKGVQWVVAMVSRIVTTFTMIELDCEVPERTRKVLNMSIFRRLQDLLKSFVAWLIDSFRQTCRILKLTHDERVAGWKTVVVSAYLACQTAQDLPPEVGGNGSHGRMLSRESTHGVPEQAQELVECFRLLTETDLELTLGDEPPHHSLIMQLSRRRHVDNEAEAKFSGAESSDKEIALSNMGSDTGSDASDDEKSLSLEPGPPLHSEGIESVYSESVILP
jgi:hypothetical protein